MSSENWQPKGTQTVVTPRGVRNNFNTQVGNYNNIPPRGNISDSRARGGRTFNF
jgi:hypothetical protein